MNPRAAKPPSRASTSSTCLGLNKTAARSSRIRYAIMRGNCIDASLSCRAVCTQGHTPLQSARIDRTAAHVTTRARSDCASVITQPAYPHVSALTTYTVRMLFETHAPALPHRIINENQSPPPRGSRRVPAEKWHVASHFHSKGTAMIAECNSLGLGISSTIVAKLQQ
jgi:hypothetical protein